MAPRGSKRGDNSTANMFMQMGDEGMEGGMNRFYSKYRAIVHDNNDPEKRGRLMLIIPEITMDQPFEEWVSSSGGFAGKDYGMQLLPQKGDTIWVEFERGHPEKPLWGHGYHGEGEYPKDEDFEDPATIWFKSPGGTKIAINDTKGYLYIIFKGEKQGILVNKNGTSIIDDKKIFLGSRDKAAEPIIKGQTHNDLEAELLSAIINIKVLTPMGPSSAIINFQEFEAIRAKLPTMLSTKVNTD